MEGAWRRKGREPEENEWTTGIRKETRMKNYHSEWPDRSKRRQINGRLLAAKKVNERIKKMT